MATPKAVTEGRVVRRPPRASGFQSLDEVATRPRGEEKDPPPIGSVAQSVEIEGQEAVPDEEPPYRRERPTMTGLEVNDFAPPPPDDWDGECRGLEDVLARFPVGDGTQQYFIKVTRLEPRVWNGLRCDGIQRYISHPMSYAEFVATYGGGKYDLMAYGPPKSTRNQALYFSSGPAKSVPLLKKPVTFVVPYDDNFGGVPPNPSGAFEAEDADLSEVDMNSMHPARSFPRTPGAADAKIHQTELEHRERDEQRRQEREERLRQRADREANAALGAVQEAHQTTIGLLTHQLEKQEAQKPKGTELDGVAKLIQALRPEGDMRRARDETVTEINLLTERHDQQMRLLTEKHERDLQALRQQMKDAEDRLTSERRALKEERTAAEDRIERRVQDERDRSERLVREAQEKAQREVESLTREHERDLQRVEAAANARLTDLEKHAVRDLASREAAHNMALASTTALNEAKVLAQTHEIERLRGEISDLKQQLSKRTDIGTQLKEIRETASLIGMTDEGPGAAEPAEADWKKMLVAAGSQVLANLPEVLEKAGQAVSAARGRGPAIQAPGQPPIYQQPVAPGVRPPQRLRQAPPATAFRTEADAGQATPPVPAPRPSYAPPPPEPPLLRVVEPMPVGEPVAVPAAPQPTGLVGEPPRSIFQPGTMPEPRTRRAPRAAPAPSAPASPAPPAEAGIVLSVEQLREFRPSLEMAFVNQRAPSEVATEIATQAGPALALVMGSITPNRLLEAIRTDPNGGELSPLVRREGARWIQEVYKHLLGISGAPS